MKALNLLERKDDGIAHDRSIAPGDRSDFAALTDRVRHPHGSRDRHREGPDLLQNLRQGGLLLGVRSVDVRAHCKYYYGIHAGVWRMADSVAIAATRTVAKAIDSDFLNSAWQIDDLPVA